MFYIRVHVYLIYDINLYESSGHLSLVSSLTINKLSLCCTVS